MPLDWTASSGTTVVVAFGAGRVRARMAWAAFFLVSEATLSLPLSWSEALVVV